MQLVTRAEWGAVAPTGTYAPLPAPRGTKIHYTGEAQGHTDHSQCAAEVRAIQRAHMADPKQGWLDIAYNWLVCAHGSVFEGRGIHHRSGANGDRALNEGHYAVCGLVGSSGVTVPSDAMLTGLRDVVDYAHANGAGAEVLGHRDGYATTCPGDHLYQWVQKGAPRPGAGADKDGDGDNDGDSAAYDAAHPDGGGGTPTPPVVHPFPGREYFSPGQVNAYVTELGHALVKHGFGRWYRVGPGPAWSEADRLNTAEFQASQGWTGDGADGHPGPLTWHRLGLG